MPRSYIGVTTDVSVQSSPINSSVPSGRFQIAGLTVKGPLYSERVVRSITEYTAIYGERAPYDTLYDTARLFFQEGGAELIVTRVVGPNATNGFATLRSVAPEGGTATDVATIQIKDPGEHSAAYQAIVTHNNDTAGTFNLSIVDGKRVIAAFQRAESIADLLSLAMGNPDVEILAAPGGEAKPAATAFTFTAGNDNREQIEPAHYVAALDNHKAVRAGVAVAIPGQLPSAIAQGLANHCAAHGKIGILEIPAGYTIGEASTEAGAVFGKIANSSYVSMPFYPALRIPDGADRSRTVGPAGYVAAHRSVTHRQLSYAAAVAGSRTRSKWSVQPVTRLSEEDTNELNNAGVNAIQTNTGVPFINNWSSLSEEPGLYDLNVQDALNNLTVLLQDGLSDLIWRPNEGREALRASAGAIVDSIMQPLSEGGYLFPTRDAEGNFADNGYSCDVEDLSAPNNTQVAPYDQMVVNVGIRLSPVLRHVHVPIRKVDLRQGL